MNDQQRREQNALRDVPDPYDDDDTGYGAYEDNVLCGRTAVISHAGEAMTDGAVEDADQSLLAQLRAHHEYIGQPCRPLFPRMRARDTRQRSNRTQILVDAFAAQMGPMTDAYLDWSLAMAEGGLGSAYTQPEDGVLQDKRRVFVVDLFSAYYADVPVWIGGSAAKTVRSVARRTFRSIGAGWTPEEERVIRENEAKAAGTGVGARKSVYNSVSPILSKIPPVVTGSANSLFASSTAVIVQLNEPNPQRKATEKLEGCPGVREMVQHSGRGSRTPAKQM
ncbi:hypothetical protein B0H11DRAFT_1928871 [Mycena galericulata]|nr:hypothetical protein B0H11DRAFT_1928871 [Mycena galericulata]